jgi:RNA-directed DNA polymerase
VVAQGRLHRTEDGVPQGGVASPLLLNVALHGMEQAAGVRYHPTGNRAGKAVAGSPVLVRYADDLVALCHTRQQALEVKARLAAWLAPRGLAFNEDKTRVVSLADGFDFLGFNVRRYRGKLLIKPSKAAVRRIRERLRTELRSLRGFNAGAVVRKLNPIIRGWANYYRTHVAAEIFDELDHYLWRLTYKWARFSHANKSASWVTTRYFGKFNKARQDRWVFGDRHSGAYLHRFSWTNIVRHQTVWQRASPDDPELADYWARRRSRAVLPITNTHRWLLKAQDGCCPICKTPLFADQPQTPSDWAAWLTSVLYTPAASTAAARRFCPPTSHQGLLEPCAGKLARTVLRGAWRGNAPGLPDTSASLRGPARSSSLQSVPNAREFAKAGRTALRPAIRESGSLPRFRSRPGLRGQRGARRLRAGRDVKADR